VFLDSVFIDVHRHTRTQLTQVTQRAASKPRRSGKYNLIIFYSKFSFYSVFLDSVFVTLTTTLLSRTDEAKSLREELATLKVEHSRAANR
jgi:hypothetical protein